MMKTRLMTLLLALMCAPCIMRAQIWRWEQDLKRYDPSRWSSETVVYATLTSNGHEVGGLTLAALVDGELRGYCDAPRHVDDTPQHIVYTLRVKGDDTDWGRPIEFRVINKAMDEYYRGDDVRPQRTALWTGETEGKPSAPIAIQVAGLHPVEGIYVVRDFKFFRQDYDTEHPLDLTPLYNVLPEDADNRQVTVTLPRGYADQGEVVQDESGRWTFVPYDECKGTVRIRVASVENLTVRDTLSLFCMVRVDSLVADTTLTRRFEVGAEVDFTPYYAIMPYDADNTSVSFGYDHTMLTIVPNAKGEYIMTGLRGGDATITVTSDGNPEASVQITVTFLEPSQWYDVQLVPTSDDLTVDGTTQLRAAINTDRLIRVRPMPAGSYFAPERLSATVTAFDGRPVPTEWVKAYFSLSPESSAQEGYVVFRPMVPGHFTLGLEYDYQPVTDAEHNAIAPEVDAYPACQLQQGWNWVSAWPAQDGLLLSRALADSTQLVEARTQNHYLVNDPELGYFAGFRDAEDCFTDNFTLDRQRDNGHFRIKLREGDEDYSLNLLLDGTYDYQPTSWQLAKGWTWVAAPYIYDVPLSVLSLNDAFVADDVIKGHDGIAMYSGNYWQGSLTTLRAGQGYAVMTNHGGQVDFDIPAQPAPVVEAEEEEEDDYTRSSRIPQHGDATWQYDATRYMDNMGIVATLDPDLGLDDADCAIGAFVGNECRGVGHCVEGRWYIVAHGQADEHVTLRLLHQPTATQLTLGAYAFAPLLGTFTAPLRLTVAEDPASPPCIYSLQGIPQPRHHTLRPGIYIHSGRKKVVR